MFPIKTVNILDTIVEQKKLEVAKLPARVLAAGDLRDAMLEHGERRDFIAALKSRGNRRELTQSKSGGELEPTDVGCFKSMALIAEV